MFRQNISGFAHRVRFIIVNEFVLCIVCILASTLVLQGCEQVLDVELPYEEKIVVNAFVGYTWGVAWISKTMPIGMDVNRQSAAIMDAEVRMKWQDSVYVLGKDYTGGSFTFPDADSRWLGDSLTLTVDWRGKHAESRSRMPELPIIKKVYIKPRQQQYSNSDIYAVVEARAGTIVWVEYGVARLPEAPMAYRCCFFNVEGEPAGTTQEIDLYVMSNYNDYQPGTEIELSVFAADRVYNRYLTERKMKHDDPFNFGGTNPPFNVTGDGIGLFIPVATQAQTLVLE